jgi:hypothetical protein
VLQGKRIKIPCKSKSLLFQHPTSNETLCEAFLESVPAPIGGLLFFVWQKKSHPVAALFLRACGFRRGLPEGASCHSPSGCSLSTSMYFAIPVLRMQIGFPADLSRREPQCSAANGRKSKPRLRRFFFFANFQNRLFYPIYICVCAA